MSIPKVFISYSHDSQEHKKWVLDLATRLRNTGVDAIIDQWELKPGDDLPLFMEGHLADSDYILMVCTDSYVQKANAGIGGVGYEKMIITSELLKGIDSNKVIPIIRQNGTHHVPTFLRTKLFIDLSQQVSFEFNYDELIRTLHNSPLYVKPEIGNNPFTPVAEMQPEKSGDPLRVLMSVLLKDFEKGIKDYSVYQEVLRSVGTSRIMLDIVIVDAIAQKLVIQSSTKALYLTDKGKLYCIEHKLLMDNPTKNAGFTL